MLRTKNLVLKRHKWFLLLSYHSRPSVFQFYILFSQKDLLLCSIYNVQQQFLTHVPVTKSDAILLNANTVIKTYGFLCLVFASIIMIKMYRLNKYSKLFEVLYHLAKEHLSIHSKTLTPPFFKSIPLYLCSCMSFQHHMKKEHIKVCLR